MSSARHRARRLTIAIAALAIVVVLFEGGLVDGAVALSPWSAPEPDRAALLADLGQRSPAVKAALADGTVAATEVRAALAKTVACMTAAGVRVEEAKFTDDGHVSMRYSGGTTVRGADAADAAQERCFRTHTELVAEAYGVERMPTNHEMGLFHDAVVACLEVEGGYQLESAAALDGVGDRQLVRDCQRQAEATVFGR